jgi:hypothetical protein
MRSYTLPITTRQLRLFQYFSKTFELIDAVPGAVVECGVGKGRTFLYLSFLSEIEKKNRTVWGFDSFKGFPEPSAEDASVRAPKAGEWSGISPSDITAQLTRAGLSTGFVKNNVHLVPGFFPESFSQYTGEPIALLHVDVDLYTSYKEALAYFEPKVVSGGVVLFDEYDDPRWPGAKKAIDEYFGSTVPLVHDEKSGKYYLRKS